MNRRKLAVLLGALVLGGCQGTPATGPAAQAPARAPATARFVINIPRADNPDLRARYVSGFTRSVSVSLSGASSSTTTVNVSEQTTVTMDVPAFAGANTFTVNLFSGTGGTGSLLSTATATATLAANTADTISVSPLGVPATITLAIPDLFPSIGTPVDQALTVTAFDAAGGRITGTYSTPVTLNRTDAAGLAPLSPTSVPADLTAVTSSYNGGGVQGQTVTYTATTAGGATSNTLVVTPVGPLVLSASTVDIRAVGTGLGVTATQINGTVTSPSNTCSGIATIALGGPGVSSRIISITGNAVGTCTITVSGTDVPNQSIDVGVTATSITVN